MQREHDRKLDREHNDPRKLKVKKKFVIEYSLTEEYRRTNPQYYKDMMNGEWKVFKKYSSQKALDTAFDDLANKQKIGWKIGDKTIYMYDNYIFRKPQ